MRPACLLAFAAVAVSCSEGRRLDFPLSPTPFVQPRTEWTIAGTLTDLQGAPVSLAWVYAWAHDLNFYGADRTEQDGRYRIVSTRMPSSGFLTIDTYSHLRENVTFSCQPSSECDARGELTVHVRLTRVMQVVHKVPVSMRVGETVDFRREIHLQDGRIISAGSGADSFEFVHSTNSAVIAVEYDNRAGTNRLRAVAPGSATIVSSFRNVQARTPIGVE